jgi:uncharacterized protein (DUF433 family)
MNFQQTISRNPEIMNGKPIISGTRITVEVVLKKLSEGATINDLINMYPQLSTFDILACLEYASNIISNDELLVI